MADNESIVHYTFSQDETLASMIRYNNIVPISATYLVTGDRWRTYTAQQTDAQSLVYYGKEVGHKKYKNVVSAFTFSKTELNCLNQETSNKEQKADAISLRWQEKAVDKETSPAAFQSIFPSLTPEDISDSGQVSLEPAASRTNFLQEPCDIELQLDTSTAKTFPELSTAAFQLDSKCQEVSQCGELLEESYWMGKESWPACLSYDSEGTVGILNCDAAGDYSITFTCQMLD